MKMRLVLFALILAFPVLYVSGAVVQFDVASLAVLLFVAAVCCWLLIPERKT